MNIRLRNVKGETIELVEGYRFVEFLDDDGKIAAVAYTDAAGAAHVTMPKDTEQVTHYAKMFAVEFADSAVGL